MIPPYWERLTVCMGVNMEHELKARLKCLKPNASTPAPRSLTPKQKAFVNEYLIDLNAAQAAIRAGYSKRTAKAIAYENLTKPYIQAAIAVALRAREERTHIKSDQVLLETARIAFFDVRKMFHADGRPKSILELDDDTAACIVGLEVLEEYDGAGRDRKLVGHVKKYKIADKNAALERGAKFLNMFEKDNEGAMNGVAKALNAMSNTERAVRVAALLAKAAGRKSA